MNILLLLIPLSLLLLLTAVWAFVWAVRRGQFDDLDTPAIEILVDEPPRAPSTTTRPAGAGDIGNDPLHDDAGADPPTVRDDDAG